MSFKNGFRDKTPIVKSVDDNVLTTQPHRGFSKYQSYEKNYNMIVCTFDNGLNI